jgi:predicted MFS family arabinose efflux permease
LAVFFLARTVLIASHRIVYPFLPSIARGLGISLAAASGLITLRLVAGLTAPFLGALADRYGRRRVILAALGMFILASLLLAGLGTLWAVALAFVLYGLAKVLFDPAVQAYLGDTIPYQERGRAIGIVELSWSCSWLLGVPLGWGWRYLAL